jgi:hypothetical protein
MKSLIINFLKIVLMCNLLAILYTAVPMLVLVIVAFFSMRDEFMNNHDYNCDKM